jgi:hypothetical protein
LAASQEGPGFMSDHDNDDDDDDHPGMLNDLKTAMTAYIRNISQADL